MARAVAASGRLRFACGPPWTVRSPPLRRRRRALAPRRGGGGLGREVEGVLQDLARTEGQHAPRADLDLLAGLGVATDARLLVSNDEVPEAAGLDLLAALEGLLDGVEDHLHDLGRLLLGEADFLVDVLDDVCLGHGRSPPGSRWLSIGFVSWISAGCQTDAPVWGASAPWLDPLELLARRVADPAGALGGFVQLLTPLRRAHRQDDRRARSSAPPPREPRQDRQRGDHAGGGDGEEHPAQPDRKSTRLN